MVEDEVDLEEHLDECLVDAFVDGDKALEECVEEDKNVKEIE
jgi:hypothetical protein